MKLYLIEANKDRPEWQPWHDKAMAFVVRASHPSQARNHAAKRHGDEGPEVWLSPVTASCRELKDDGPVGVVLRDFANA